MISFVHSGYGAEHSDPDSDNRIWSHKWRMNPGWTSRRSGVQVSQQSVGMGFRVAHLTDHLHFVRGFGTVWA
jgi:hypothetical protein